jgi:hypothetical protein
MHSFFFTFQSSEPGVEAQAYNPWEAKIRRMVIRDQPKQKVHKSPHFNQKKLGMMACTCHPINDKTLFKNYLKSKNKTN